MSLWDWLLTAWICGKVLDEEVEVLEKVLEDDSWENEELDEDL